MKEKSMLEQLKEEKALFEKVNYIYYNNGKIKSEDRNLRNLMSASDFNHSINGIMNVFKKATSRYAYDSIYGSVDFDTISMEMAMGIIFDKKDVVDGKIKEGSNPEEGMVRYYTGSIDSYSNGEKTNEYDYNMVGVGNQGLIDYNKFVKYVIDNDLDLKGPQSFEELKNAILSGEVFNIEIVADFTKDIEEEFALPEDNTELVDVYKEEKQLVKKHHLFKKH